MQSTLGFTYADTATPYTTDVTYTRYKRDSNNKIIYNKDGTPKYEKVKVAVHTQSAEEVFLIFNIKQMFGIDKNYPGVIKIVNTAYLAAKAKTPYKTGYSRNAFMLKWLNDDTVKIYYDRNKIVGGTRDGREVRDYYPVFWFENKKLFNFLDIISETFYDKLFEGFATLLKKNERNYKKTTDELTFSGFKEFIMEFEKEYYKKKDEAARKIAEEKMKKEELERIEKDLKIKIEVEKRLGGSR